MGFVEVILNSDAQTPNTFSSHKLPSSVITLHEERYKINKKTLFMSFVFLLHKTKSNEFHMREPISFSNSII